VAKKRTKRKGTPRARRRGPADYFLAVLGIAIVVFAVAMLLHARSCHIRLSDEIGLPAHPTPRPTPEDLQP
jgi:hypothetical protein